MRSNRLLLPTAFDYEYPRLLCSQLLFEARASLTSRGLRPREGRPGDRAFHDAPIRFGGRVRVRAWRFRSRTPERTEPLTPLSLRRETPLAFASAEPPTMPRPHRQVLREEQPTWVARSAFHRQRPRVSAARADLECGHVTASASIRHGISSPTIGHTFACRPKARRPSPSDSKSVEMEALASLRQNTNCRLLQRHEDARAQPRASDPRAHRREGVSTRAFASPSLPLRAFWAHLACDSPSLSSKGGQRATPHQQRYPRTGASLYDRERWRPSLFPCTSCEGAQRKPTDGCAADGRDDDDVCVRTNKPWAKGRAPHSQAMLAK